MGGFERRGAGSLVQDTVGAAGTGVAVGKRTLTEGVGAAPVQMVGQTSVGPTDGGEIQETAARGVSGAGGAMPHGDTIQRLFGRHDVSGVQAHVGGDAATASRAIGAEAYATGNHVAFAGSPSVHTAAHEAAHVVQQRAGVHLKGGVGAAGDAYEQHADQVADAVVQGKSAEGLLDRFAGGGGASNVQRQAVQRAPGPASHTPPAPPEMTAAQVTAALAWVTTSKIGVEAIKEIQGVCGIAKSGAYDEATAKAVFAKQHELHIGADGMAGNTFCQRTGIIFTHEITAATVADADLEAVKTKFPNGVTVAIYPDFEPGISGKDEFGRRASQFATNQQAVGLSGGAVALGQPCKIKETREVIEIVQSIHRGLLKKWTDAQPANSSPGGAPAAPPAYTKVLNLALFCHGETWGMGLNAKNDFGGGGLHNNTTWGQNPANVEAFVRGLSEAVVPGVRVELFACLTAHDATRTDDAEWHMGTQGDKAGGDSFASSMAQALGPSATVAAHTTAGHTTENYAARVFGAEAGGGTGGIALFDAMYPETYVQSELTRLFPDLSDEDRASRHDSLRMQMWAHFQDATHEEVSREDRGKKRLPLPMGQEALANPVHARELLDADWRTNWIPTRLAKVQPAPARGTHR